METSIIQAPQLSKTLHLNPYTNPHLLVNNFHCLHSWISKRFAWSQLVGKGQAQNGHLYIRFLKSFCKTSFQLGMDREKFCTMPTIPLSVAHLAIKGVFNQLLPLEETETFPHTLSMTCFLPQEIP